MHRCVWLTRRPAQQCCRAVSDSTSCCRRSGLLAHSAQSVQGVQIVQLSTKHVQRPFVTRTSSHQTHATRIPAQVTLPNGLRLLLLRDTEVPLVRGSLLMAGGQAASPGDKVGAKRVQIDSRIFTLCHGITPGGDTTSHITNTAA